MMVVLATINLLVSLAVLVLLLRGNVQRRQEERVQAAMDEQVEEELRRGRAMDEGFDNLMRFAVNGHDGFGGDG